MKNRASQHQLLRDSIHFKERIHHYPAEHFGDDGGICPWNLIFLLHDSATSFLDGAEIPNNQPPGIKKEAVGKKCGIHQLPTSTGFPRLPSRHLLPSPLRGSRHPRSKRGKPRGSQRVLGANSLIVTTRCQLSGVPNGCLKYVVCFTGFI